MQVIGKISHDKYICEVQHTELEKFLNQYYGYLNTLEVGNVIDLGKGYDFASEVKAAMKITQEFIKANGDVIRSILNGIQFLNTDKEAT